MDENFLSDKETLERIVRLETQFKERTQATDDALRLARDLMAKDLELARQQMDHRLEGHNQWQVRWDKRELSIATKDDVDSKVRMLLGVILAVATILGILMKMWGK